MHHFNRRLCAIGLAVSSLLPSYAAAQSRPSVETFKQVMTQRLQKLMISGFTQRDVRFIAVQAGAARNGVYSFRATIVVRDYEPGYPKNKYYGRTCIGKLINKDYTLAPDDFGGWRAEGVMTPDAERSCQPNPAEGISSIPVESLEGTAAAAGAPVASSAPKGAPSTASGSGSLASGEWACFGSGGRPLIGMGFKVVGNNAYTDLEGGNRGSYAVSGNAVTFSGGHLGGQKGRFTSGGRFSINMVECEPYR